MNNGTNWQEMKESKEIIYEYVIKIVWNANNLIVALSETLYTNKKSWATIVLNNIKLLIFINYIVC
jgi:hypothetical protein